MKHLKQIFLFFAFLLFIQSAFAQKISDGVVGEVTLENKFVFLKEDQSFILESNGLETLKKTEGYYFVFKKVTGDFVFTADLKREPGNKNRIGIMVRNSLDEESVFGEIGVQDSLLTRKFRHNINRSAGGAQRGCLMYENPEKMVVERKSEILYYRVKVDDKNMQNYGADVLNLNDTVLVGMFIKVSGNINQKAEFFNVELNGKPVEY